MFRLVSFLVSYARGRRSTSSDDLARIAKQRQALVNPFATRFATEARKTKGNGTMGRADDWWPHGLPQDCCACTTLLLQCTTLRWEHIFMRAKKGIREPGRADDSSNTCQLADHDDDDDGDDLYCENAAYAYVWRCMASPSTCPTWREREREKCLALSKFKFFLVFPVRIFLPIATDQRDEVHTTTTTSIKGVE